MSADGNAAIQSLLTNIDKEVVRDQWTVGYFRGQLATINLWMAPDKALVEQARQAIDAFRKSVPM